jgi:hypothetical protein
MKNSTTTSKYPLPKDKIWTRLPERVKSLEDKIYKVYTAIITQTGNSDPTAVVLANTLGGEVTFSRNQAGQYNISSSDLFGNTAPFVVLGSNRVPANTGGTASTLITRYNSSSQLALWSMNPDLTNFIEGDGAINNLAIEIRVYN